MEKPSETIRSDGGEEEYETDSENEDSHQGAAPRPAVVSCRRRVRLRQVVGHQMSCSSSATSASLLEHRALRALATRKLHQHTLAHFLTFVAKRSLPILEDTQMDTALTVYCNAQYMFGVQHHRGSTLMAALMHRYPPILETRRWQATMIPAVSSRFGQRFLKACQPLNLQNVMLQQARHSGPNIDRAVNVRPLVECKSRGQWRTNQNVQRYEKSARLAADYLALPRRTARNDRNLRTTCRGSHPWNQPWLCLQRRLFGQHILHLFAPCDVVASRIRAYGVPCYSICKDQTCLALQRAYRVNLRRDVKDRRTAGALLTPPRGTDSLSLRLLFPRQAVAHCTETVDYLIVQQQQHLALFFCPPAGHTAEHMTSDLYGHGGVANGENVLGFPWVGLTPEIVIVLQNIAWQRKVWQLFFQAFEAFFAFPTRPVFRVPCTVSTLWLSCFPPLPENILLQSDTGFWHGRYGVARNLFPQSRTARTKVSTSRAILLQPVPSKLFTTVVLFVSHHKKNFLHHR